MKPLLGAAAVIARHPSLWWSALVQARRLAPHAWWRHWPPQPAPPASYLAFRLQTQHGPGGDAPTPDDLVAYLRWCRDWNRYESV